MLAINCIRCLKEFKVSGSELEERHSSGVKDLCNICILTKEKPVKKAKNKIVKKAAKKGKKS